MTGGERPLRVGVIGTGFGSAVQIPGFQAHPGTEVVAVCSGRAERARQAAARFGLQPEHAYTDYRQMLAAVELDLVSIVTPPDLHKPMTLAALERGCHVLCEKPMALDLAEAHEMLAAAEARGKVHAITHEFRYSAGRQYLGELVRAGYLGEPPHELPIPDRCRPPRFEGDARLGPFLGLVDRLVRAIQRGTAGESTHVRGRCAPPGDHCGGPAVGGRGPNRQNCDAEGDR